MTSRHDIIRLIRLEFETCGSWAKACQNVQLKHGQSLGPNDSRRVKKIILEKEDKTEE